MDLTDVQLRVDKIYSMSLTIRNWLLTKVKWKFPFALENRQYLIACTECW